MIHSLRQRLHAALKHKEFRYLVSGAASEAIEYISFLILYPLTHKLYLANSLSFGLGVLSGFVFHKLWSFAGEHRFKTRYQFFGYVSLAAFNFLMINVLVGYLVHGLNLLPAVAKLVAIIFTVSWTYVITNKLIFRHTTKPADSSDNSTDT